MKIAVVILNWNGKKLLENFLPSLLLYSKEATIYVADNASTDDSIAYLKKHFPTVKIIENKFNFGFAKGYNQALESVEEEIYALVNSDIEVTQNWLQPILHLFENEPNTSIIQPKILDYKNKKLFEYAGAGGGFIDRFGFAYCRGRIFESIETDNGQYNDTKEIFWASGACFFIRKKVFRDLKGFDNDFFAHQEEIDLCWRAINHNYLIKYCGKSTVYHVGAATLKVGNPNKTFLNFRNSLYMLVKNLPSKSLVPILFTRLLLDGLAGIQFVLKGKLKHCFAILKAHYYFYINLFKFVKRRNKKQSKKYYKINSVVYNYYLLNGKIFDPNKH